MSSYDPNQPQGGQQPPAQPGYQGQPQPGQPLAGFNASQAANQAVAKFKAVPANIMGLVAGGLSLIVILVFSFFPYYRVKAGSRGYSASENTNAWDSWVSVLGIVLLLLGALAVAAASSGLLNSLGRNLPVVRLAGAAVTSLALLLFLLSWFYWPDFSDAKSAADGWGLSISQTRHVGFYLILLFALAIVGLSWYVWTKTKDAVPASSTGFGQVPQGYGQAPAAPGYGQQPPAPPAPGGGYGQQPPAPPAPGGGYAQQPPAPPAVPGGHDQQPPAPPAPGGHGQPQG